MEPYKTKCKQRGSIRLCPNLSQDAPISQDLSLIFGSDHCPVKSEFFLSHPEEPHVTLFSDAENKFATLTNSQLCSSNWPEFLRPRLAAVENGRAPSVVVEMTHRKRRGRKPQKSISPQKPPSKKEAKKMLAIAKKKETRAKLYGLRHVQHTMNLTLLHI